jgi:hypothetical protein
MHAPSSSVVLDLDAAQTSADPYRSIKTQFELAKQLVPATAVVQGASDAGASAVATRPVSRHG